MATDDKGLIHGGFTFSLADYAAMVAVNHPNVVLSKASFKFIKPVKVGETIIAIGKVDKGGEQAIVDVEVKKGDQLVAMGTFDCYIPKTHVLEARDK